MTAIVLCDCFRSGNCSARFKRVAEDNPVKLYQRCVDNIPSANNVHGEFVVQSAYWVRESICQSTPHVEIVLTI